MASGWDSTVRAFVRARRPMAGNLMKKQNSTELETMRHSTAHVMAAAVCRLFENVRLDIGPATEDGFYYDFDLPHRLGPEDFPAIEAEMAKIVAEDHPFERIEIARDEARRMLEERSEEHTSELQ